MIPYLLIEDSTYSSRIASCPKLEDIHICDDVPLPLEDNCVLNLLKNEDKCAKIKVHLKETLVQQIGRGDLLVYTPDSVNIYYNCNEVVRINNDKFIFQEDLLRGEIFNLPKLDLNTYNVTNEESIQLNKQRKEVFERLLNRFRATGNVAYEKVTITKSITDNEDNKMEVLQSVIENPNTSTRVIANEWEYNYVSAIFIEFRIF
ncbi:hypothetical protein QE152_g4204 [Popillia japonica]|uniref:Uncharacterized protein n=1 Tax=Popillia japonica TaxID=7064 RepID=A0AAW1N1X0_POPJA